MYTKRANWSHIGKDAFSYGAYVCFSKYIYDNKIDDYKYEKKPFPRDCSKIYADGCGSIDSSYEIFYK